MTKKVKPIANTRVKRFLGCSILPEDFVAAISESLYKAIAHGDAKHRAWLKRKARAWTRANFSECFNRKEVRYENRTKI